MMKDLIRQVVNVVLTAAVIFVNYLANGLPLGGKNTGEIAAYFNQEPTLVKIIPAPYAFSIWGLIYIGLIAFVIYQLLPSQRENQISRSIGWWYALSCVGNIVWIFVWHMTDTVWSFIPMFLILASLIMVYLKAGIFNKNASPMEKLFYFVPFSLYLGWITVASIVNISSTIVLVPQLREFFLGIVDASMWSVIILAAGMAISGLNTLTRKDYVYPLVTIWAYVAIAVRNGFSSNIGITALVCSGIILFCALYAIYWQSKPAK